MITKPKIHGVISKNRYTSLKKERGKCEIYRKRGGVNLNDLHSEIQKVMNSEAKYSLYKNNCIHFALSLLGLEKFYSQLVQIQNDSSHSKTTITFLLFKTNPGHGEVFEEVSKKDLQPGDIVLFPMMSSSSKCTNVFQHAAVFCGSGEVIHFMASSNAKSLCLISSSIYQGVVVKQGFKALKKLRGKCEIYQKKDGVNLNDLCSEIQKVMDSEAKYSFYENNCIHFTLSLLGLEKFYSQLLSTELVSQPRWDDSCIHPQPYICILT
ncbi:uncharacterized protein [Patagioenas fasciata]|uniref:uncharacterized protein n=1 Tax=Patagioenas fasciata TaxID=372321 RepID=UPI003A991186